MKTGNDHPLESISRCVSAAGETNLNTGDQYKKCVQKYDPNIECIRHGKNDPKHSPEKLEGPIFFEGTEQIANNSQGKIMHAYNFKTRILEESFQEKYDQFLDKGKNFVRNNPYLTLGLGGAAAGAAMNYFGDGAEDLKLDREKDIEDWMKDDAREELANKAILDKNEFASIRDPWYRADAYGSSIPGASYWAGKTEDIAPTGWTPESERAAIHAAIAKHPELGINFELKPGEHNDVLKFGDFRADPNATSDIDWARYKDMNKEAFANKSDEEIKNLVNKDPELSKDLKTMQHDVEHATRDSYLKKTLGGAALGAGGLFAKRKLDERRGVGARR